MKKVFLLIASAAMILASCEKTNNKGGIFKGPDTKVYHGKAWTWIELDEQDKPLKVAISINDAALNSVAPASQDDHAGGHSHDNNIVLQFHPKADATPFKHVWLNWNPNGHPPTNIYTLPHFDMHFYMVPSEERETYVDQAKLDAVPAPGYVPANHIGVDPIPAMGMHFVDLTAPELNGAQFTQTFIFGSYDRNLIFWEPMITLEFLKNTTSFERMLPQPAKFQQSGYYPTKMRIVKENDVTNIILDGFVYRQAS
ncbi:MAG TPA: hypothetical protein VGD17_12970 [Chitinophagaceae bacterium]